MQTRNKIIFTITILLNLVFCNLIVNAEEFNISAKEILIDKEGFTAVNFGVIAVPEKFFVKSDGSFAFKINGPLDMKSLDKYISRLLEEDK